MYTHKIQLKSEIKKTINKMPAYKSVYATLDSLFEDYASSTWSLDDGNFYPFVILGPVGFVLNLFGSYLLRNSTFQMKLEHEF